MIDIIVEEFVACRKFALWGKLVHRASQLAAILVTSYCDASTLLAVAHSRLVVVVVLVVLVQSSVYRDSVPV